MKKLILLTALAITGCTTVEVHESKSRIIGKEDNIYKGFEYQIIEIDGVEYISSSSGGICPLVKK